MPILVNFANEINKKETYGYHSTEHQQAAIFRHVASAMPEQDKLEVFDRLRKSLFVSRFDRLLKSVRTDELSMDDITREVEAVRQKHYEEGKQ